MERRRTPGLVDVAILGALVASVLWVAWAYVKAERFVYFWDDALFQDMAWDTCSAFRRSWIEGEAALFLSFEGDYNAFYTLPLCPLLARFGDSRLAYVLSLAFTYLCPFALAVGALGARLASQPRREHFWTSAFVALLVPIAWIPTLRGYPDAGAAAVMTLTLALYLGKGAMGSLRSAFAIGALLALATLFRRHFVWAALAFVLAATLSELAGILARRSALRAELPRLLSRVLVGGLGAVVTASIFGQRFVARVLTTDFHGLYRAYQEPPASVAMWYVAPYGWGALLLAAAGLFVGARTGVLDSLRARTLGIFAGVALLQWVLVVRQLGEQYTLHFTPYVAVGLSSMLWAVWRIESPLRRGLARTALVALLVVNTFLGLTTTQLGGTSLLRPLFAGSWPPLQRWGYEALGLAVDELRRRAAPNAGVFVAASSRLMNPDLLRHAEWARHGRASSRLSVLPVPSIDSRDDYPLGMLLEASYVVLVHPIQYHLRPEEQKVLRLVDDLFTSGRGLAADFVGVGADVHIGEGAMLRVWQRVRPTDLGTALRTLDFIEQEMPSPPGGQPDWVVVNRRFRSWLARNPGGTTKWIAHPASRWEPPSTTLAYLPRVPPAEVSGWVRFLDRRCPGAMLSLAAADASGALEPLASVIRRPGLFGGFRVPVAAFGARRLTLSLVDAGTGKVDRCLLEVDPLAVAAEGKP